VRGFNEALYRFAHEDLFGLVDRVVVESQLSGDYYVFIFSITIDTTNENFIQIVPEDQEVRRLIKFWLGRSHENTDPIIKCPRDLVVEDRHVRRGSTNFGNLIADIICGVPPFGNLSQREACVGLINSGSFRLNRNIQKNEGISKKILCDIFFHPNCVQKFNLKGAKLRALLEKILRLIEGREEGHGEFLQISGVEVEVRDGEISEVTMVDPEGDRHLLDPQENYAIATTNYVASECDKYKEWFEGKEPLIIADDIKNAVEIALGRLQALDKLRLPFLPQQPKAYSFLYNYLALMERPRWKF
jgi:2',3'-cyclic-nucleotide 2'-phosphodiesterase (5'-nucleotidase family)